MKKQTARYAKRKNKGKKKPRRRKGRAGSAAPAAFVAAPAVMFYAGPTTDDQEENLGHHLARICDTCGREDRREDAIGCRVCQRHFCCFARMMVHDQCRAHFLGQPWEPPDLYTMPGDQLPLPELPDQPTPPEIPDPEGEREPGGS